VNISICHMSFHYVRFPFFRHLIRLQSTSISARLLICCILLLSQFVSDVTKYISGCMASLSAMIQLELPLINVLTKVDLLPKKRDTDR